MFNHDGWMGFGGGYMWLVLVFNIVVIVILIKSLTDTGSRNRNSSVEQSPLTILKQRFARGEINEEEYRQRRRELEAEN